MQRIIGVVLGAAVTFLVLFVTDTTKGAAISAYGTAVIVGAVVAAVWPPLIGFYLSRRAKDERDEKLDAKVQAEVERKLAQERENRRG